MTAVDDTKMGVAERHVRIPDASVQRGRIELTPPGIRIRVEPILGPESENTEIEQEGA